MRSAFMDAGDLGKYGVTRQEINAILSTCGRREPLSPALAVKFRPWLLAQDLADRDIDICEVPERDEYEFILVR